MSRGAHTPHPPTDRLSGRWIIERAEEGEATEIAGKPGTVWALTVRHAATGAREYVQIAALARTRFAPGQEIEGRLERRWSGIWFRRARPAVRRG